jgi:hypothetical protein
MDPEESAAPTESRQYPVPPVQQMDSAQHTVKSPFFSVKRDVQTATIPTLELLGALFYRLVQKYRLFWRDRQIQSRDPAAIAQILVSNANHFQETAASLSQPILGL